MTRTIGNEDGVVEDCMVELDIGSDEVAAGQLTPEHRQAAVTALEQDGLVVLNGVVDTVHLDLLAAKMDEDIAAILRLETIPYQFVVGHTQHDPPPFEPYLFRDVVCNDLVVDVTRAVLGEGVTNTFYSGNTNLPGSGEQPVHIDWGQLWPGLERAHPACRVVVNISPIDVGPENGSTEVWLGSHLDTTMWVGTPSLVVPSERVEARRRVQPPVQPRIEKGGVLIRDIRLWHRGVPNTSQRARPMIAMIHGCRWLGGGALPFPAGAEAYFEHEHLQTPLRVVAGPIDYLDRHKPHDFHG